MTFRMLPGAFQRETEKKWSGGRGKSAAKKVAPRHLMARSFFCTRTSANNGMNISASVNAHMYDSFSVCGQLVVFN
jgi:hypothetical protein